jgi:hypothetical protein
MTRILSFSVAIIAILALSVLLAVFYIMQHETMDKALQGEGTGIFHEKKRDTATVMATAAEMSGHPNSLDRGAYVETRGVSGPPWKNRLEKGIEDCVRVIKSLPTSVGQLTRTRPPPRLAPAGIYFTLRYLSVASPSGITGLKPGTLVACVKDNGGVLLVTTGNLELEAKRKYLTNDLDIADLASRNDAQAEQDVASSIAQQQAMDQVRRDEQNAAFEQRQREIAAERAAAAAEAPGYSNPLERGPYDKTGP